MRRLSYTIVTVVAGNAKPTPLLPPLRLKIEALTPTRCPFTSTSESRERQGDQTIVGHHATKHFATTVPRRYCRPAYFSCFGTHHSGRIFWMRSFRTIGPHCG